MESLGKRSQLLKVMDSVVESAARAQKERAAGQTSLFDGEHSMASSVFSQEITLPDIPEFPPRKLLQMEKELVGLYMSDHPLNHAQHFLQKDTNTLVTDLKEKESGEKVVLGGIITTVKKIITKSGKPMMTGTFEDLSGQVPIVLFPGNYDRCEMHFTEEEIVILRGKASFRQDEAQVVVDDLTPFKAEAHTLKALHVGLKNIRNPQLLEQIKETLAQARGIHPVYLHTDHGVVNVSAQNYVDMSPPLLEELKKVVGNANVWEG